MLENTKKAALVAEVFWARQKIQELQLMIDQSQVNGWLETSCYAMYAVSGSAIILALISSVLSNW